MGDSVSDEAIRRVYWLGWCNAATWANRDDLLADHGSHAYQMLEDEAVAGMAVADSAANAVLSALMAYDKFFNDGKYVNTGAEYWAITVAGRAAITEATKAGNP